MKSQSVLGDLFDETTLITDHAYLHSGRIKVMFMFIPQKHIHLEEKMNDPPITNLP